MGEMVLNEMRSNESGHVLFLNIISCSEIKRYTMSDNVSAKFSENEAFLKFDIHCVSHSYTS